MTNFDFDELFERFDPFNRDFMKQIQKELREIEDSIRNGKHDGKWDVEQIDKPGVKGYIIKGYFSSEAPLEPLRPSEPFEPLRPLKRRPMLREPLQIPKDASKDTRDPLTDVMEEENAIKIYVELPGVEKDDIRLNFADSQLEIKAKNFFTAIELPKTNIDTEKTGSQYKNGLLEITIPKKKAFKPEYHRV